MSGCSLLPSAAANLLHHGAWRASSPSSAHPLLTTAACSCNARVPDRPLARHSHIRGSPRAACSLCPPLRLGTNVDASLPPPTTHGCSPSSAGSGHQTPSNAQGSAHCWVGVSPPSTLTAGPRSVVVWCRYTCARLSLCRIGWRWMNCVDM